MHSYLFSSCIIIIRFFFLLNPNCTEKEALALTCEVAEDQLENLPACNVAEILSCFISVDIFLSNEVMEEHSTYIFIYLYILLLSSRRIMCLKLYLSVNLIIVPHPVGRASSWGIVMPYITSLPTPPPHPSPLHPPSSSSVCLC